HLLVSQRAIDVGRVPVSLKLDGDHLPVLRQGRVNGRPAETTVQQDQRLAAPVDLVIHLESVHIGVPPLGVLVHRVSLAYSRTYAGARITARICSPYCASFRSPSPAIRESSAMLVGFSCAIAWSVESWKITYAGTPRSLAMVLRQSRSRAKTVSSN